MERKHETFYGRLLMKQVAECFGLIHNMGYAENYINTSEHNDR